MNNNNNFYCSRCNAVLNNQNGFNPDLGRWTCKECGQELYGDGVCEGSRFPGVMWHCTKCGSLLNSQTSFTDCVSEWNCEMCGTTNYISEEYLPEETDSNVPEKDNYAGDKEEPSDSAENNTFPEVSDRKARTADAKTSENESVSISSEDLQNETEKQKQLKRKRRKAFFFSGKKIRVGFSSHMSLGRSYTVIENMLRDEGFTDIWTVAVKDIDKDSMHTVNDIKQISIGDITNFSADEMFAYDSRIIITYHEKKEIKLPFSDSSIRRKNYDELKEILKNLGFSNIHSQAMHDVKRGFLKKEGKVEKVTFGDSFAYKSGKRFVFDIPVCITYHVFRE